MLTVIGGSAPGTTVTCWLNHPNSRDPPQLGHRRLDQAKRQAKPGWLHAPTFFGLFTLPKLDGALPTPLLANTFFLPPKHTFFFLAKARYRNERKPPVLSK